MTCCAYDCCVDPLPGVCANAGSSRGPQSRPVQGTSSLKGSGRILAGALLVLIGMVWLAAGTGISDASTYLALTELSAGAWLVLAHRQ